MSIRKLEHTKHHILICNGESCLRHNGDAVTLAIRDEIDIQKINLTVHTTRTRCNGRCDDACVVIVYPNGSWYKEITPELGRELVRQFADGRQLLTTHHLLHRIE